MQCHEGVIRVKLRKQQVMLAAAQCMGVIRLPVSWQHLMVMQEIIMWSVAADDVCSSVRSNFISMEENGKCML